MILEIDSEITLRQLERSDAEAIFETIDQQREYLGRWLPFVAYTLDISDSQGFVDSVVNAPADRFEYLFTIRKCGRFVGLIGFKDRSEERRVGKEWRSRGW